MSVPVQVPLDLTSDQELYGAIKTLAWAQSRYGWGDGVYLYEDADGGDALGVDDPQAYLDAYYGDDTPGTCLAADSPLGRGVSALVDACWDHVIDLAMAPASPSAEPSDMVRWQVCAGRSNVLGLWDERSRAAQVLRAGFEAPRDRPEVHRLWRQDGDGERFLGAVVFRGREIVPWPDVRIPLDCW